MKSISFKYELLLLTFIIILLHSFVPHSHNNILPYKEVLSETRSDETKNLFDFFVCFDLGPDHLENYLITSTYVDFNYGIVKPVLNYLFPVNLNSDHFSNDHINQSSEIFPGFLSEFATRGPPERI